MNLTTKIVMAFIIMALVAIGSSVSGWRSAIKMSGTINEVHEMYSPLMQTIQELQFWLERMRVHERSLLLTGLSLSERKNELAMRNEASEKAVAAIEKINQLFKDARDKGFAAPETTEKAWYDVLNKMEAWKRLGAEFLVTLAEWDKTYIYNPESLIAELQGFRGDHYSLASRLGTMLADGKVSGAEVSDSDTACAFGKWRIRFDESIKVYRQSRDPDKPIILSDGVLGLEYVKNQIIADEMAVMIPDHASFHKTAHEIFGLIAAGDLKEATDKYKDLVVNAGKVIGHFETFTDQAKTAITKVREKVMGEMRAAEDAALAALAVAVESCGLESGLNAVAAVKSGNTATLIAKILFIVALGLAVAMIWTIRVQLIRRLVDIIDGLSVQMADMADSSLMLAKESGELSKGANTQAGNLEETSAALEEIGSMLRRNADNAMLTSQTTAQTLKLIGEGSKSVNKMSAAMGEINESAEKIGHIIDTIEGIAFQTNLLALNAAVEAARAGDAGSGFAVVAEEVRRLAQRSAEAARDTSSLIEGMVVRVRNGFDIAVLLDSSFKDIDTGAKDVGRLIDEITTATDEQANGLSQINIAMSEIDNVTQNNAASAEEIAAGSSQISDQARNIQEYVDRLASLMGRQIDTTRRVAAHTPASTAQYPRTGAATGERKLITPTKNIRMIGDGDGGDNLENF